MVMRFHRLADCHAALPLAYFRAHKLKKKDRGVHRIDHDRGDTLWRKLTSKVKSEPGKGAQPVTDGYYICLGENNGYCWAEDDPGPPLVVTCF